LTFTDHLGTPILQTSALQGVVWRAEYEPFGEVYALRSYDRHQPLRLPGQEAEQLGLGANGVTDRRYNIHRWYRGEWGRYTQADPAGLAGSGHLYGYAANPLRFFDPFGLCRVEVRFSPLGRVPFGSPYYHAYIVTTDDSSSSFYRGGPSAGGPGSGSSGPVSSGGSGKSSGSCCRSSGSNSSNSSSPGSGRGGPGKNNGPWGPIVGTSGPYLPGTIDYPQPGETQPNPVVLLDDDSPCACNTCFQKALDDIQSQQIPYNPFLWNSNTTVKELLKRCVFNSSEPQNWVPAWSSNFP